ncbi:MAG: BLUF domain-containing protein [Rhizomicrobium sp.]|nr:BLUF domain-containing protein [Rhizomicrobium sp.]
MRQLLYVSDTKFGFPLEALEEILAVSRRKNGAAEITGLLLNLDGSFLQVLEGSHEAVGEIYAAIRTDRRHWNVTVLLDHEAPRVFGEWSMGFERLRPHQAETAEIFEITSEAIAGRIKPGAPQALMTLLRTFYHVQSRGDEI